jgi:hypothetical protein
MIKRFCRRGHLWGASGGKMRRAGKSAIGSRVSCRLGMRRHSTGILPALPNRSPIVWGGGCTTEDALASRARRPPAGGPKSTSGRASGKVAVGRSARCAGPGGSLPLCSRNRAGRPHDGPLRQHRLPVCIEARQPLSYRTPNPEPRTLNPESPDTLVAGAEVRGRACARASVNRRERVLTGQTDRSTMCRERYGSGRERAR